ncbi:MAG: hypothetical protein Q9160_008078 [Pyrenula sp. 1 TL-2023]
MADVILSDSVVQRTPPVSILPKFKLSELPLTKDQRTSIDALLNTFKKKGGYDKLRKQVWAQYTGSDAKTDFTRAVTNAAEKAIENDSDLLGKERGKAATLIEGSVDRSGVYKNVELEIDRLIASHLDVVLESVREIRTHDIGEEKAAEEAQVGSKSDEEYAGMRVARKAEREALRSRLAKDQETIDKLKAKISEKEEAKRKREEEERRKVREAEEEQRRIERHKRREQQRKEEEAREKEREERYRKRQEEERERYYKHRHDERRYDSKANSPKPELDEKAIEAAALERLINEGKALAERNKQRPDFDFEKAEAMEGSQRRYARRDADRDRSSRHYRDRSGSRERHRSNHDRSRHDRSRSRTRHHHSRHDQSRQEYERSSKEDGEIRKVETHDPDSVASHHDEKHIRERSKSPKREREPERRQSYREDPRAEGRSRLLRSASPPFNIDRYVPGGGVHRDPSGREKDKRRDYDRDGRRERSRDREKERYRESRRYEYDRPREERRHDYGDSERRDRIDRDRDREHRHRDRDRERRSRSPRRRDGRDDRRDDRRTRDDENHEDRRDRRKTFVEIDRYVPGGR